MIDTIANDFSNLEITKELEHYLQLQYERWYYY